MHYSKELQDLLDEAVAHDGTPPSADTTTADLRADYGTDHA